VNAALAKPNRANVDAQGDALRDSADELRAQ
jgi:hypothetical protein